MLSNKERNLIKGAIRRVFSRSELRRAVIEEAREGLKSHFDPERPRVSKWARCAACGTTTPAYLMEVDHIVPIIPVDRSLETMSWDELVSRVWCDKSNLMPICKPCHKQKSKQEMKHRAQFRKEKRKST